MLELASDKNKNQQKSSKDNITSEGILTLQGNFPVNYSNTRCQKKILQTSITQYNFPVFMEIKKNTTPLTNALKKYSQFIILYDNRTLPRSA